MNVGTMNVVLVNPPIRLPHAFAHYPMFSTLGLVSNAAWLRAQGHTVRVVDAFTLTPQLNFHPDGDGFRHIGAEVVDVVAAARAVSDALDGPTAFVVSVTMFSEMNRAHENLVPQTAEGLRAAFPDAPVGLADFHVCGMNYFPYDAETVLAAIPAADWILVGEGEPTLPALLDRLAAGEPLAGLPRLAHREGDGVVFDPTPPTPLKSLDELPPPAFDLLDMENYFSTQADAIRGELVHEYHLVERQLPLMTSRGCPYRCNFCTNQVLGLPWRAHSVDYLSRLVTDLRERYRVDRFLFLDDNINVKKGRFRDLLEWMAAAGVPWDAVNGYRADQLDREAVRLIRGAGNTKVTVSAESGDPELLRQVIHKRLELSSIVKLARICEEERIPLQVHYIVGVPGETKAQINKTLEFSSMLFELHGAWPLLQHAIPFPGTQLYRDCEENGYFIAPPETIPGEVLEVESIIRTPEFEPGEVIRMKHNAQYLHRALQALVYLDVETRCSNRCYACHCKPRGGGGENEGGKDGAAPPTLAELHAQLERARFLGGREVFIGGGEPTLRRDLPEIVAKVREMGFERVALVTNAHGLANRAWARKVLGAAPHPVVDKLVVDLFGPDAATHDAVARREGAFVRTLEGVAEAVKAGVTDLEASVPILRANLPALARTVQFARGLGIRSIHLRYPPPDAPAFAEGQVPAWDEARDAVLQAVAVGRRGKAETTVQGAPLCLLPEYPGVLVPEPPWRLTPGRHHRVKHPVCRTCTEYILCGGFFRPDYEPTYRMMADRGIDVPAPEPAGDHAGAAPGEDACTRPPEEAEA